MVILIYTECIEVTVCIHIVLYKFAFSEFVKFIDILTVIAHDDGSQLIVGYASLAWNIAPVKNGTASLSTILYVRVGILQSTLGFLFIRYYLNTSLHGNLRGDFL